MDRMPADPALRGLQEFVTGTSAPDYVVEAAQELAAASLQVPAEVEYVRYKPGRSCNALWSFEAPDGRRLLLSGTLLADDAGRAMVADRAFRRRAEEARNVARAASAYRYLPDRRLLLQLFPLDANLPGLPTAAAPEKIRRALAAIGALDGEAGRAEATPLSYKPWRRCVLRYQVESEGGDIAFFGKTFRDGRGDSMYRWLELLRTHLQAADAPCAVATPALYLPDARLLLVEAVEGASELKLLVEQAGADGRARETLLANVRRAAEALPVFRRAVIPGLPHVGPADVLATLERRARGLDRVLPWLADSVARRLRDLEVEAARLRPEPLGLAHGAFRHNQLVVAAERLVILDLDTLCNAGAAIDPGSFLAYLDRTALRRPRLRAVLEDCERAFVAAVDAHIAPSPAWLAWHRAAGHVKWALRSAFKLAPGWAEAADALLRLAGRTLAGPAAPAASLGRSLDPNLAPRSAIRPSEARDPPERRPAVGMSGSPSGPSAKAVPDPEPSLPDPSWSGAEHVEFFNRNIAPRLPLESVESVALQKIRYTPGRDCVVLLALRRGGWAVATFAGRRVLAEIFSGHYGERAPARAQAAFVPEGGCLVEFFPADWRLSSLAAAMALNAPALWRAFPAALGGEAEVLRYRPHIRCVLGLRFPAERNGPQREAVGKVYPAGPAAARIFSNLEALHAQAADGLVPAPLALVPELDLVLMERVGGTSLKRVLKRARSGREGEQSVALAAETLATLHGRHLETGELSWPEHEVEHLRARVDELASVAPAPAARAEELLDWSASLLPSLPAAAPCCVHRDFKPNALLLDRGRVAVLDLDDVCLGDRALDVGNFMAELSKESLHRAQADLRPLAPRFLAEYERHAKVDGLAARAGVCQSLALVRKALSRIRRTPSLVISGEQSSLPSLLLDEAAACLAGVER